MTDLDAWLAGVEAAWPDLDACADGLVGIRNAIFGLWLLMTKAPSNVRDLYRGFDEAGLDAEAEVDARSDALPSLPTLCSTPAQRDAFVRVMAVALRALELRYVALSDGSTIRRPEQCLATYGAEQAYIVPVRSRHREAATGHPFQRRALLGLRVLPLAHMGFKLNVRFSEDPIRRPEARDDLAFGAALFVDLDLDIATTTGGFLIRGATSTDQLGQIERALMSADAAECLALTLPELTVDRRTLEEIIDRMADGRWNIETLGFLIAGSCHEDLGDGRHVNVATVLDRYGNEIARHAKLFRYNDSDGTHEDIVLGDTIEVLVTEEAIVAFGICLDFCNQSEPSPYPWMDVDYVLVPSCGGESTMRGHVERSSELIRTMRTRSFVVQQHWGPYAAGRPPLGYILARADREAPPVASLATGDVWTLVRL